MVIIIIFLIALAVSAAIMGFTNLHIQKHLTEGKIRIACVGDSITYGCGIPFFFVRNFPVKLQKLLGNGYQIENFGVNDTSVQADSKRPYIESEYYRKSLEYNPDIVVLFLGINDSEDFNWHSEEKFSAEYLNLLNTYIGLPSRPRIIILTPPQSLCQTNPILKLLNNSNPQKIPVITASILKIAETLGIDSVNITDLTVNHRELLCPDGLHLNAKGAQMVAEKTANMII